MRLSFTKWPYSVLIVLPIINGPWASEIYVVSKNKILSIIAQEKFPDYYIYGKRGMLKKLISLNPQIKDPNKIRVGETIILPDIEDLKGEVALLKTTKKMPLPNKETPLPPKEVVMLPVKEEEHRVRRVENLPLREDWNLGLWYGSKLVSLNQSGSLGNAEFGQLFLSDLKFRSEFLIDSWSAFLNFNSYKFSYESLHGGGGKTLSSLEIGGTYKYLVGAFSLKELPSLRNNAGTIELTKVNTLWASFGLKKDIQLPTRKQIFINLKSLLKYPMAVSSSNAEITFKKENGLGFNFEADLNWEIYKKDTHFFFVNWRNEVDYQKLSYTATWGTSNGKVRFSDMDFSSSLGLNFTFE